MLLRLSTEQGFNNGFIAQLRLRAATSGCTDPKWILKLTRIDRFRTLGAVHG
jgi:hypothetical protein